MPTDLFGADFSDAAQTLRTLEALATREDSIGLRLCVLLAMQELLVGSCDLAAQGVLIAEQLLQVTAAQRRSRRHRQSENSVVGYLFNVGTLLLTAYEKMDANEQEMVERGLSQRMTVVPADQLDEPYGFAVMTYPSAQALIQETVATCLAEIETATNVFIGLGHAIASGKLEKIMQRR